MIQPKDIARKAEAIYREYLKAWLAGGDSFFPRLVPAQRNPGDDVVEAITLVRRLREGSKEVKGYGYTVEWKEVRSRRHGRNPFPQRILIETEADLLRLAGKEQEFRRFEWAAERLRSEVPELEQWMRSNIRTLIELAPDLDGLIEVTRYLRQHPRPDCFARELPLSVDTKFVSQHVSVLRQWLDRVLSPGAIRSDEEHFERRFGIRYAEPFVPVRLLDPSLLRELCFPAEVVSLPLNTLAALDPERVDVLVVENLVNLLTLPPLHRTIALGGIGNAVSLLRYVPWLSRERLVYWGDLDTEGLCILSMVRALHSKTESVFMDIATCERYRSLMTQGSCKRLELPPACLTPLEHEALCVCLNENLRLEQERIPQPDVLQAFTGLWRD